MKKPNKTLHAMGIGRMTVKYHAHALTLFAVFWSLPSALCILILVCGIQDRDKGHPIHMGVGFCVLLAGVAIHLCSIIGAVYYWLTERKRKVTVIKTEGEIG